MLLTILLIISILLVITFIVIQYKSKKNIWQKISFLYNKLYIILIEWYYNDTNTKKDILKEEILDYYKDIVNNNLIDNKYKHWQDVKWFILQYYNNQEVVYLYDILDVYYNKYYKSVVKSILILVYLELVLVLALLYIEMF